MTRVFQKTVVPQDEYATRWAADSVDASIIYVGEAVYGAAESSSSWRVQKIDTTNGAVTWAGAGEFDQRWDQRESSLVYS